MDKGKTSFADDKAYADMKQMLAGWKDDSRNIKKTFLQIKEMLHKEKNTVLNFVSRPGVSYSLRASYQDAKNRTRPMFALVDIIDDDPENRWLSVCFYLETITDPEHIGNLIPQGILGDDGYCFDLDAFDLAGLAYVKERVNEAYAYGTTKVP
jgi:hypothetical protein